MGLFSEWSGGLDDEITQVKVKKGKEEGLATLRDADDEAGNSQKRTTYEQKYPGNQTHKKYAFSKSHNYQEIYCMIIIEPVTFRRAWQR